MVIIVTSTVKISNSEALRRDLKTASQVKTEKNSITKEFLKHKFPTKVFWVEK